MINSGIRDKPSIHPILYNGVMLIRLEMKVATMIVDTYTFQKMCMIDMRYR